MTARTTEHRDGLACHEVEEKLRSERAARVRAEEALEEIIEALAPTDPADPVYVDEALAVARAALAAVPEENQEEA